MALRSRPTTRDRPAVTPERKSHPLFWLLVLVALMVIAWSLYNRYASHAAFAQLGPAATSPASRPVSRIVDAQPLRPARTTRSPRP